MSETPFADWRAELKSGHDTHIENIESALPGIRDGSASAIWHCISELVDHNRYLARRIIRLAEALDEHGIAAPPPWNKAPQLKKEMADGMGTD